MFDDIYKIVVEATDLNDLYPHKITSRYHGNIDTRKKNEPNITVAAQLAKEAEVDKVEWLRLLGANVNAIAYGYALAGNDKQVEIYRTEHQASFEDIAEAYAQAGNHDRVEEYREKYPGSEDAIARGYAKAGDDKRVEEYREKYQASVYFIAAGYAEAGNHERVEAYLKDYKDSNMVASIAYSYARAGYHEQAEAYREKYRTSAISDIARGYAFAGNDEQVEIYRTKYKASVNDIACGYAKSGNHERVGFYLRKHNLRADDILNAYINAGYELKGHGCCDYKDEFEYIYEPVEGDEQDEVDSEKPQTAATGSVEAATAINKLLDDYLKNRRGVTDSSGETKQYFYNSFFFPFQKSFTQKAEAVRVLKRALDGNDVDLSEHLSTLRNGKLGEDLRRFIKSGGANALVEERVDTVSDFVRALQDKNRGEARNDFTL